MSHYISPAVAAQAAANHAATIQQNRWLANAATDGDLPVHDPLPASPAARVEDDDPDYRILRRMQAELATANRSRTLLTILNKSDTEWTRMLYPSHTSKNFETFIQPSGFRNIQADSLPLCPHYLNPRRTATECRMRCRSHRMPSGETIYYLQVPREFHVCSFIAILRHKERRPRSSPSRKRKRFIKGEDDDEDEVRDLLATPSSKRRGGGAGSSTAGPSTASSSPSTSRLPVIDLSLDDFLNVPSSSPTPSHSLSPVRRTRRPVGPWTGAEARLNLLGDSEFISLTRQDQTMINDGKDYNKLFWMHDGPDGRLFQDTRFPERVRPFSSGYALAKRIALAGPVGPHQITKFLTDLATTDGVSPTAWTNFLDMLRVCHGCGGHFTPAALNAHLIVDGDYHRCGNHPAFDIVSPVQSVPYGELLRPHFVGLAPPPFRRTAPYFEYALLTALGIALSALNTVLGLPDDVFQAARLGVVPCADCARYRTVHAHLQHFVRGVCGDVGPRGSCFIARNADEVTEVAATGERTTRTNPEA
ncbi:hypothetical protein DFH06DRAFT_1125252 [Mycena polygramma]|nr:hypothetical protein DFH06DRAFT_1345220 [Mycena polygramma]KAJ7669839.1 hypothetical protein DFH06DRAFT_1125252 [Mycena polygramma]